MDQEQQDLLKLLESMKPKPPTLTDLGFGLVNYCLKLVLLGVMVGIGLRIAGIH